jgi:hypothetical protein
MKSKKEIREKFEQAVECVQARHKLKAPSDYMEGVENALGWVLEEFDDDPVES